MICLIAPTKHSHQLRQKLYLLPLLLPFRAALAFPRWRAPVIVSGLALPFLGLVYSHTSLFSRPYCFLQLFQLHLPASLL